MKSNQIEITLETVNELMNEMRIERTDVEDELVDYFCVGETRRYLRNRKEELDTYITASLNVIKALRIREKKLRK